MFSRERIILGCGNFGGVGSLPELVGKGDSRAQAHALLDRALDLNILHFDTANSYGGGASEIILGEWLASRDSSVRRKIKIATKVGNPHGCRPGHGPLGYDEIQFQLQSSLDRLGVRQIHVYYLHELPKNSPLDEAIEALSQAVKSGQISSFGLSNVSQAEVESFIGNAGPSLSQHLSHVQNEFHFLNASDGESFIPFLKSKNINYSAFSPLAGGLLTGKYKFKVQVPAGSRLELRREPYEKYLAEDQFQKIDGFIQKAGSDGFSPAEAALRFVLDTPGVHSAIIGPRKREHYEDLGLK